MIQVVLRKSSLCSNITLFMSTREACSRCSERTPRKVWRKILRPLSSGCIMITIYNHCLSKIRKKFRIISATSCLSFSSNEKVAQYGGEMDWVFLVTVRSLKEIIKGSRGTLLGSDCHLQERSNNFRIPQIGKTIESQRLILISRISEYGR